MENVIEEKKYPTFMDWCTELGGALSLYLGMSLVSVCEIVELIARYVAVGFGTIIAEIPAPYDRETIERLIGEVAPLVRVGGVP